jgi:hypothetical protein
MRIKPSDGSRDIKETFTQIYLTLMSVIQGVALGYLATAIDDSYNDLSLVNWILVAATFSQIVGIWHNSIIATIMSAWIPTLADSIIPFLVGAGELFLIASIRASLQAWLAIMAILSMAYLLAYLNHSMHMRRRPDEHSRRLLARILHSGTLYATAPIIAWLMLLALSETLDNTESMQMGLAIAALLLMWIHVGFTAGVLQRNLYKYFAQIDILGDPAQ